MKDQNLGATSDLDGNFKIKGPCLQKVSVISAIGYETHKFVAENESIKVELTPKIYELSEFLVTPKKHDSEFIIDSYNKSSITYSFACGSYPWDCH